MEQDAHYFLMRAEEEEAKAKETSNEAARACHLRMATVYRQCAANRRPHPIGDCQSGVPTPTNS